MIWDPENPATDPNLRAALMAGLAMSTRRSQGAEQGDLDALSDVEKRMLTEIERLKKMQKASERITKGADDIQEEIRKGKRAFELLLDKAKDTLRALNVELVDVEAELRSPIKLPTTPPSEPGTRPPRLEGGLLDDA